MMKSEIEETEQSNDSRAKGGRLHQAGSVPVLSDEEIADMFEGTNFGSASETANGRRGLMVECILKHNAGYVDGSTIINICRSFGLLDAQKKPTWAGSRWAFTQIYESGKTIVERLAQNDLITHEMGPKAK